MSSPTRPSTLVRSRAGRLFSGGVALATILTLCVLAIPPAQADPSVKPSVRALHRQGRRLRPRLRNVPVRGVRRGAQGPDLEADPGLLLPRHQADHDGRRHHDQGLDQRRHATAASGCGRPAASPCVTARGHSFKVPTGSRYTLVADHPIRIGIQAQLPQQPREQRQRRDQAVDQHLEVLQLGQGRQARAAQRIRPALPGLAAAGEERQQRPDRQPGQAGRLRQGRRPVRDADLLGRPTRSGPRPWPPARTRCGCGPTPTTPATTSATPRRARSTAGSTRRPPTGTPPSGPPRGVIVTYRGKVALTQFASSNGGHTAQGGYPYLRAHADRYDGVVTSQKWTRTITTASIKRAWPSVGTVRKLQDHEAGRRRRLGRPGEVDQDHRQQDARSPSPAPPSSGASGCARACSPSTR